MWQTRLSIAKNSWTGSGNRRGQVFSNSYMPNTRNYGNRETSSSIASTCFNCGRWRVFWKAYLTSDCRCLYMFALHVVQNRMCERRGYDGYCRTHSYALTEVHQKSEGSIRVWGHDPRNSR